MPPFPDLVHPDGHVRNEWELLLHHRLLAWDIRPEEKVIIIGGYYGSTVQFILDWYPEAEIYTFDPQPGFYAHLVKRFSKNPNVHVYPYGLGIRDGVFPMARTGSDMASFLVGDEAMMGPAEPNAEGQLREWVSVMKELGIDELAWFHSNIEQYEYILLPHIIETGWLANIGQLVVATHAYPFGNPDAKPWYEWIKPKIEETHKEMWDGGPQVHQWWAWSRPDRIVRDVRAELEAVRRA